MKTNVYFKFFFIPLLLLWILQTQGQIVINEVSSRNAVTISDFDGDYPDWIELLNTSNDTIGLLSWFLSDDINEPDKWSFPEISLPPDSHLVVFASSKFRRILVDHWETAIHASDTWKYWMPYEEPDSNWKSPGFDDLNWPEGPGGFGRGDGDDNTVLPDTVATVYLRKAFTIPDTSKISFVLLHVDYDDAFVAYLNGIEIARSNIGWPGKIQKWDDYSYDRHFAKMFTGLPPEEFPIEMEIFRSIIKEGENILAIQALNAWNNDGNFSIIPFLSFGIKDTTSSYQPVAEWFGEKPIHLHTNFNLSGQGESIILSNPDLSLVDMADYPYLKADQSYGRETDGSSTWKYFGKPTPGAANEPSDACSGYTKEPHFNLNAGFYNDTIEVSFLNYQSGDTIRYTIDGSWVTDSSAIYSGEPVQIDTTVVFRAQVYKAGFLPGKVTTNTYLIGYTSTLPVVSVSLNPHDLWDWEEGIYVLGPNAQSNYPNFGANFWMDWQKPSHVEYFDESQNQGFELDADIMIHGGYSRALPMKSMRVITDSKYDDSEINYQLFKDKDIQIFNKFVLHNSGQDFTGVLFRDAIMQKIVQKETQNDILDYQPVAVFLNGQYWGIHNIREKVDKFYVNSNFGVPLDSMHVLRDNIKIVEGNYYEYMQMIEYIKNVPVVDSLVYDSIAKLLDVSNYSDYFIAAMYYVNPDWPLHNTKYWRSSAPGSKWRYIMIDMDFGLGLYSQTYQNELSRVLYSSIPWSDNHWALRKLIQNADYRRYFINRSADMFNTMLLPQNIVNTIDKFKERLSPEMLLHLPRWGSTFTAWEINVQAMSNFAMNRLPYVWQHYIDEFDLEKLVTVSLDTDSAGHGKIQISSIIPDSLPWQGVYFDGNPVEISAIPDSGYVFSHWNSNMIISGIDTLNQHLNVNIDTNDVFTAHFIPDPWVPFIPKIVFSEINYHAPDTLDPGDWVEVWNVDTTSVNLSGWVFKDDDDTHAFILPEQTLLDIGNYLVLCRDTLKFKTFYADSVPYLGPFEFGLASDGDDLRLFDSTGLQIISMTYSKLPPWPTDADGTGKTLELIDPFGNLNDGSNWFAGCPGGSPGTSYSSCDTVSVEEYLTSTERIRIYPNPAKEIVFIELYSKQEDHITLTFFDALGNQVIRINHFVNSNIVHSISVDVSGLHPGIYFIQVKGKEDNYTEKFFIQ